MAEAWYPYYPDTPSQSGTCSAPTPCATAGLTKVISATVPLLDRPRPSTGWLWPRSAR